MLVFYVSLPFVEESSPIGAHIRVFRSATSGTPTLKRSGGECPSAFRWILADLRVQLPSAVGVQQLGP